MLSSTGGAWGTKSLMQDAQELAQVVDHFRTLQKQQQRASGSVSNVFTGKIALMGHSTGCQDIIEYLCGGAHVDIQGLNGAPRVARNPVEAAILQAPVSDREALELSVPAASLADAVTVAENLVAEKRSHEIMPSALTMQALGPAPVSAARFLALASPGPKHAGADDYFSSDLDEARLGTTFGRIPRGVQLQVLMSEADEHVPERVDKEALVERWKEMVVAVWDEDGGVIDGARHGLDGEESEHAVRNVIGRVLRLLERVRSS
ncbi:MAG: hypothetical protein M1822_001921 [Bathelium mastoideum]|nr:MAG: hypothetical protein M1822_001921 [Bathelium mastoideum]